jgi:hypothetical protein
VTNTKTLAHEVHPFFQGKGDEMDYWEAWRVKPGERISKEYGPILPKGSAALSDWGVKVPKVNANDWFSALGAGDQTRGLVQYMGTVYYFDCMGNGELKGFEREAALVAGGLLSVKSKEHPEVIQRLFTHHPAAMAAHDLAVAWDTDINQDTHVVTWP